MLFHFLVILFFSFSAKTFCLRFLSQIEDGSIETESSVLHEDDLLEEYLNSYENQDNLYHYTPEEFAEENETQTGVFYPPIADPNDGNTEIILIPEETGGDKRGGKGDQNQSPVKCENEDDVEFLEKDNKSCRIIKHCYEVLMPRVGWVLLYKTELTCN